MITEPVVGKLGYWVPQESLPTQGNDVAEEHWPEISMIN
jgi:hypothetical protein